MILKLAFESMDQILESILDSVKILTEIPFSFCL